MFINPKQAIERGWIRNIKERWIQPNAVDISADKLFEMNSRTLFRIDEDSKTHRERTEVPLIKDYWILDSGIYDFASNVYVEIPEGIVGWVVVRSSFNRNGVYLGSGLYDSGYKGPICGTLYVHGTTGLKCGTPVGQFILAQSDSHGTYAGGYNVAEGKLPSHIKQKEENK
jgi:deoxycytidine triphosphate deaminase